MKFFSKTYQFILGLSTLSGVATVIYITAADRKACAFSKYVIPDYVKWNENWDGRASLSGNCSNKLDSGDGDLETVKPGALRHLILIRHGQYVTNGHEDRDRYLTSLGRIQAEYTAKRLKEINLPYNDIIKSTLARAQETGTIIEAMLPDVPVKNCDLIREGIPAPPEPPIGQYGPNYFSDEDAERIEEGFKKYFYRADSDQEKDSYSLIVCHANVIRYFVCRALQFPREAWLRLSLNHASITWITILPNGRCILKSLGDSGHMPSRVLTM